MTTNTSIEWTDVTWNPVRGCSRVSAGCDNCYAIGLAHRFSGPGKPYEGLTTIRNGKVDWTGKVALVPEVIDAPRRWRKSRRVFVNSMSDLFHPALNYLDIYSVFDRMAQAEQHTFQVLTKRPDRMLDFCSRLRFIHHSELQHLTASGCSLSPSAVRDPRPLPNVWLGVSVEDQATADDRIPLLLQTPAAVRWISAEPLLGPLDLSPYLGKLRPRTAPCLDWIVVGGESGHRARPCDVAWIRSIVAQCKAASVPCFVKQLGAITVGYPPGYARATLDRKGGDPAGWPEDLRVREFPA